MASLKISTCFAVFTNGRNFSVISKGSTAVREIHIKSSENQQKDRKAEGDEGQRNSILACEFSPSGKFFAVCDDQKQLHVYETSPDWQIKSIRTLARRCIALAFTETETEIVVADKAGDAYIHSTLGDEHNGKLILGHISMLTDVVITNGDKFVATSDRDEKIRISHYPNAYNIHSFCLGHTEFISKLIHIKSHDLLLSGGGDGTIRLWDTDGKQIDCMVCDGVKQTNEDSDVKKQIDKGTVKCLAYSSVLQVLVIALTRSPVLETYKLHLGDNPSFELKNKKDVSVEPWDVQFDDTGALWVLLPSKAHPVQFFKVEESSAGTIQLVEMSEYGDWSLGITCLNANWKFFEEAVNIESIFATLWKGKVDNMPEYLEKKQKRLQEKQKNNSTGEGEPVEKKPKTDT